MVIHPVIFWLAAAMMVALTVFWVVDRIRVAARFRQLEEKISGNVVPYWKSVQSQLIKDLTHPHRSAARADELLRLLKANPDTEMCDEDREELLGVLKHRAEGKDPDVTDKKEQRKAALFPLVMEEVQDEAANPNPITEVQVVGIKKPE